ncbi:MAG: alpha-rhamnosidase [Clostridia bacterium]|nr:alpha-rhamnosidase [Clostridia bacterium]
MSKWIWYPGDFELYHDQKVHMRRKEKGVFWPCEWDLYSCSFAVTFRKEADLASDEKIRTAATAPGRVVVVDGSGRHWLKIGEEYKVPAGHVLVEATLNKQGGLCAFYLQSAKLGTDEGWQVRPNSGKFVGAASNGMYEKIEDDPEVFKFSYKLLKPAEVKEDKTGVLYDFGRETFAKLIFSKAPRAGARFNYGESLEEAKDTENCPLFETAEKNSEFPAQAFRYLFFPGLKSTDVIFEAYYEYLPHKRLGSFKSSDRLLNKIWETSAYTLELNSREFYLDGLKRDRWVWSGDAYQSCLVDRYLYFDKDIARRTMTALRGRDPVKQFMNTIVDYSMYWILMVYDHYMMTGDAEWLKSVWQSAKTEVDFIKTRKNGEGFIEGIPGDWTFIDWSDMDKTGAVCAEQILFWRVLDRMDFMAKVCGDKGVSYANEASQLASKIRKYYWRSDYCAFIDSYASGKNHITRHANIFALLFGFANKNERRCIIDHVITNSAVTPITTPYFKFFELEAMAQIGDLKYVMDNIRSYWGGMLAEGATSIWEEYKPGVPAAEQLAMYGRSYDKSLCHAWGASPVYLLGKYVLGVRPTSPGYGTFEVEPRLEGFKELNGTVPIQGGIVTIRYGCGYLSVETDRDGGVLKINGKSVMLRKNQPTEMPL